MWMHRFFGELEIHCGRWNAAERELERACPSHRTLARKSRLLASTDRRPARRRGAGRKRRCGSSRLRDGEWRSLARRRSRVGARLARPLAGGARGAHDHLQRGHAILDAAGLREPGLLRLSFELAEAAAAIGKLDQAERLADQLDERAAARDHPWASAAAARCRGIAVLGAGDQLARSPFSRSPRRVRGDRRAVRARAHTPNAWSGSRPPRRAPPRRRGAPQAHRVFGELRTPAWQERPMTSSARLPAAATRGRPYLVRGACRRARRVGRTNREVAAQLFTTVKTWRPTWHGSTVRPACVPEQSSRPICRRRRRKRPDSRVWGFPRRARLKFAYGRVMVDAVVRAFLVETYVPGFTEAAAARTALLALPGDRGVGRRGAAIELLQSFALLGEETLLSLFSAASAADVRSAAEAYGEIACDQLSEVVCHSSVTGGAGCRAASGATRGERVAGDRRRLALQAGAYSPAHIERRLFPEASKKRPPFPKPRALVRFRPGASALGAREWP